MFGHSALMGTGLGSLLFYFLISVTAGTGIKKLFRTGRAKSRKIEKKWKRFSGRELTVMDGCNNLKIARVVGSGVQKRNGRKMRPDYLRGMKMKIKSTFITQQIGDRQYMVSTGEEAYRFKGMISSNRTAAAIVDLLKEETTEKAVVDAMFRRFDAPREKIEKDVRKVLDILRSVGALEE